MLIAMLCPSGLFSHLWADTGEPRLREDTNWFHSLQNYT